MLHVGLLASPGLGHLIPILALGNRLVTHHNVKVTVLAITTATSAAETQILKQKSQLVDLIQIPPPLPPVHHDVNAKVVTRLFTMVRHSLASVRSTIADINKKNQDGGGLDVLIVDLFCAEAFPIATEFNLAKYVYIPSNAWFTAITIYCHVLDKQICGQYVDQKEPLRIPGCKSVRPEDVVEPMLDRNDRQYAEYVKQGIELTSGDGILMNTWEDLEPTTLKAMREDKTWVALLRRLPVYPIGPVVRGPCGGCKVKEWLDMQPSESVVYVSFGSGGSLSDEQIRELAWGLEMSEKRFLWVVRRPTKSCGSDKSFFTTGMMEETEYDFLPEGFVGRTRKVGLVVQEWAQQVEILEHCSVGGFLSHCGWNSCLESIMNAVPIIAWPLYAEQRTNATMLTEELGVAVRPKVLPTQKVVGREEIGEMIRRVMEKEEGKVIRDKIRQLKVSGDKCLGNGGSSFNSMSAVLENVKMGLKLK